MAPSIHLYHLAARPRAIGAAALVAGSLLAIALGQAHSQPRQAPVAPRHAAFSIQRARALAAGQIARPAPMHPVPLASWHSATSWSQNAGGGHHHGHRGGGG
jgi:hypothetical protein